MCSSINTNNKSRSPSPTTSTNINLGQQRFIIKHPFVLHQRSASTPRVASANPSDRDVICGRGKLSQNHTGNKYYRQIIAENLHSYSNVKTKMDKSLIVSKIVDMVQEAGGNFIKRDCTANSEEHWVVVEDNFAREKTAHSIRDAIRATRQIPLSSEGQATPAFKRQPACRFFDRKQSSLLNVQRSIFRLLQTSTCIKPSEVVL